VAATGLAARLSLVARTTPLHLSLGETRFCDRATTRMNGTAFRLLDDRFHAPAVPCLCIVLPEVWRERPWSRPGRRAGARLGLVVLEGVISTTILLRHATKIADLLGKV
jgi:hypothetical protein